MEDNKYYIPVIEDIHIGYECEFHGFTTGGLYFFNDDGSKDEEKSIEPSIKIFYPIRCGIDPWSNDLKPENIYKSINNNQIRTPYLTKEQIEKEGWKFKGKTVNLWFEKGGNFERTSWTSYKATMYYNLEDYWMTVYLEDQGTEQYIFQGKCPSINEFRTICKLLNIK